MGVAPTMDPAAEYVAVLRGFGISPVDLDESVEVSDLSPGTIATELGAEAPAKLHAHLRTSLARSARGIEAPREYWSEAPCFQIAEAFEPYGYEVELTPATPGWEVETFEIELRDGDDVRRTRFTYPDSELGTDNYPALVHAVETRLLADTDLTFVRLADPEDDGRWRFLLVERDRLAELREDRGDRIDVFDRPLLARQQPDDFATGEDDSTSVAASEFEAVFDTIEPTDSGPEAGDRGSSSADRTSGADGSDPVAETVTGERLPDDDPVSGDTPADADEPDDTGNQNGGFEWLSDVESSDDDQSEGGAERRTWTGDPPEKCDPRSGGRSGADADDGDDGRLSDEIATILYPDRSPSTAGEHPSGSPSAGIDSSPGSFDRGDARRGNTDGGFDADARTEGDRGVAFPEMNREFRDVELDEEWEPPVESDSSRH